MTSIMWFRRDLRLGDHPALVAAAEDDVLPLVVLDPDLLSGGGVRTAAYVRSVAALKEQTEGRLVVRSGDPAKVVPAVAREVKARAVHISAESEPFGYRRDQDVRAALQAGGVELVATGSSYAIGPGVITKADGSPYKVFTPFSKAWREHGAPGPAPTPSPTWASADSEHLPDTASDIELPEFGEDAARRRWAEFCEDGLESYAADRDRPDLDATSRMSVALKYGAIHPRTMLADIAATSAGDGARVYVDELIWREFYADVLWHRPDSEWGDLRTELSRMDYDDPDEDEGAREAFVAWTEGRTGYPIVDAGMRQLVHEGWMHNRLRMITASFLCKDLHLWWPHGARHFLAHLVDGDVASNNHGWQWAAGTGTDAAPYFRVFNPITQGKRFDPRGDYVRRYVPELAEVEGADVHDLSVTSQVEGYVAPIVDHAEERREALRRYEAVR
ncbi:MAG: deoxyribodipyrimidine photo-lyase [Mobilicoccus sp.]|nr:deoxyribodipyrimidine photo-lyase [Mobilicoccus sp.]